jgi:hypothetical protein
MTPWQFSKFLIQSFPPDRSESKARWAFGLYEILDDRHSPMVPRVFHATYRGLVELSPDEIPSPEQNDFTAQLEDAVVKKWKSTQIK